MTTERPLSWEYAFTITLKPHQYVKSPTSQIKDNIDVVKAVLLSLGLFTIVWEFTKNMNIHFHGVLKMYTHTPHGRPIKNLMLRWYNSWRKQLCIGFTNLKVIDDEGGWLSYIGKCIEQNNNQLTQYPSPVLTDLLSLTP